jgi:hypothetical protein
MSQNDIILFLSRHRFQSISRFFVSILALLLLLIVFVVDELLVAAGAVRRKLLTL